MPRSLRNSNAHFQKAVAKLPLGVSSNFRYWGEDRTIYVKRGKGARLWDLDDNCYVDYRLAYGPAILGYAHPDVDEAARRGMDVGGVFALGTEREYTVAKRISKMVPAAELVRFSNSGTEAVMAALRLARSFTGREEFVVVEGGYHGLFDAVLWQTDVENWTGKGEPGLTAYSEGVPSLVKSLIHSTPMNDASHLEDLLKRHASRIAAVLIEPIQGNCCALTSTNEYVHAVRALCTKYGVVMIVDDVKTGFRVAKGGIQELYNVKADVCTMAKAVANGYPIAVVAGREDIMRKFGRGTAHGGTYTAHSVSLAAAEKTLEILDETDALVQIDVYGRKLMDGLSRVLKIRGIPHVFTGTPAIFGLFFSDKKPMNYRDWKTSDYTFYDTLAPKLQDRCVLVEPDSREPWFMSAAHDESCLKDTLTAFEHAVDETLVELRRGGARKAS